MLELNTGGKIRYAFRRPRFPLICAVGNELRAVTSPAALQRQVEHWDPQGAKVLDIVDATGEGWAFHLDLRIVSPLTLKKHWKKIENPRFADIQEFLTPTWNRTSEH